MADASGRVSAELAASLSRRLTVDGTPELVKTLAAIEAEAARALAVLATPNRPPGISGQSALTRIKNMAGDRVGSLSSEAETTGRA